MACERTLSIIKPDAVEANITGKIISMFEDKGFSILGQKRMRLIKSQAESFYYVHKESPFFHSLVAFMISGPCVIQVLERDNAVFANRELMGATDPKNAAIGTIRKLYGSNIEQNVVHGSDSLENAKFEIQFFFSGLELNDL